MIQSTLQEDATFDTSALDDDHLVAEYFGELRRFELLKWEEETALWQRMEQRKTRARRALYTSSVALPTLKAMWRKVIDGERALHDIVEQTEATADEKAATYADIEQALRHLSDLAAKQRALKRQRRRLSGLPHERRALRQEQADVWRDWLCTWEQMCLHPGLHEAMSQALDNERRANPDDPAVRASHQGWQRAQRELEQAKTQMLCANLRLVVYVAKKYRDQEVPLLDLIQEGNIGLMRAIDRFEPERGLKFVTYAYWWVRQAVSRTVIEQGGTVRLPIHVVERQQKIRATSDRMYQVHGRLPTSQELSAELGWSPQEIERLWGSQNVVLRLHAPLSDDGQTLEDIVEDERVSSPDAQMEERELRQCLSLGLAGLTEREARVLRLRFGLESGRPHHLREIGEQLGLSHERIRQIEHIALEKLRAPEFGACIADFQDRRSQD